MSLRRFHTFLIVLAVMILGLMALGAGVRTMNAGLSCPDWPLCFGKVIPDFHVGVWFEFVHRAYAGLVAILYAAALVIAWRSNEVPTSSKTAAKWGLAFLTAQIVMGGLTVLLLVKAVIVTTHLLLATLFLCCVLWMLFGVRAELKARAGNAPKKFDFQKASDSNLGSGSSGSTGAALIPKWMHWVAAVLPLIVFLQIAIGGLVASTYAGSVCVDWPLCNGQWVPTWKGAIGLQIIHRFFAYSLVILFVALAGLAFRRRRMWSQSLVRLFYFAAVIVIAQTWVGILNLLYFIPPHITVPHQTLAMLLLATALKIDFDLRQLRNLVVKPEEYPVAAAETLS